jgi:hypothetical protein
MASDSVTLVLNGDPTLDDLATALDGLRDLLLGLEQGIVPGNHIAWVVDDLQRSSALVALRGEADDSSVVEAVASAYLDAGKHLHSSPHTPVPYNKVAQRGATKLVQVLKEAVPSIRFETLIDDITFSRQVNAPPAPSQVPVLAAYGAIEGRLQTLSNRGGLRFTLYDLLHDKAVSCYPEPGRTDIVRDAWGHLAVVEGWVKRDPESGRPLTIRNVRRVAVIPEAPAGDWRRAYGALSGLGSDEPPEATIRRIRAQ